jgi:hypothetical protein
MTTIRCILLAFLSLSLCACISHTYIPDIEALNSIPEFSSTHHLSVQNAQVSAADVIVLRSWQSKWHADLQACTEALRSKIEGALASRGLTIEAGAPKSLRVSVEKLETEKGFATIITEAVLSAETSSGYSAKYRGRGKAVMAGSIPKQCDDALRRAAQEMLNDPEIVAFLTR